MPVDLAAVVLKRGREEPSGDRSIGCSAGPSKRGRGRTGGKVVFECTICGKACSQTSDMAAHERTHIGDRPYACTTCGNAFSQSGSLARHCAKVHALDQE